MASSNVPLLHDDDTIQFGDEEFANSNKLRHPYVTFFHLFFRLSAIVVYLLCDILIRSFIGSFVTIMLLLSMDFWTVKNITGRLMVGLRWWNYVNESGDSCWVFESKKGNAQLHSSEVRTFWLALVLVPLIWSLLFIIAFFRFNFQWLVLVGIALTLSGANLYAYIKCRVGVDQPMSSSISNISSNFFWRQLFPKVTTMMTRSESTLQHDQPHNLIEPMQVDAAPEDNDNTEEDSHIVENPSLDLEAYANSFTGLAKLNRLKYIADHCPTLKVEALKMGLTNVVRTYNVTLYKELHKSLLEAIGNPASLPDVTGSAQSTCQDFPSLDVMWIENKLKKSTLKLEKLDGDLKNYKSNSIKESIRRGHDDLGDHYLDCGDLPNALKCYSRARDYCTSGKHVVNMCLNVIKVSIYLQNWTHVMSYVAKAEATPDFLDSHSKDNQSNQAIMTRLKCAAGLAELSMKKYKIAAKFFLLANLDYCDFPEMMSASNVAVYGGLCALATFDRSELQKNVILSSSFKLFLELEPQLRDIIFKFYESKYASCLTLLEEIKDNLLLDMYIAPHVSKLYSQIRNRALIQYFSPYMSADMNKMAAAFNTTITALEDELMQLILDGQIQARIDSHNKILYAKEVDQRSTTFERSLVMGKNYQRRTRMLILRTAVLKNQIQVRINESPQRDCSQQSNEMGQSGSGNSGIRP